MKKESKNQREAEEGDVLKLKILYIKIITF